MRHPETDLSWQQSPNITQLVTCFEQLEGLDRADFKRYDLTLKCGCRPLTGPAIGSRRTFTDKPVNQVSLSNGRYSLEIIYRPQTREHTFDRCQSWLDFAIGACLKRSDIFLSLVDSEVEPTFVDQLGEQWFDWVNQRLHQKPPDFIPGHFWAYISDWPFLGGKIKNSYSQFEIILEPDCFDDQDNFTDIALSFRHQTVDLMADWNRQLVDCSGLKSCANLNWQPAVG